MAQNKTFISAMKEYFGILPGQTAMGFGKEVQALSYEEKMDFHGMLNTQAGIQCDPPANLSKKD